MLKTTDVAAASSYQPDWFVRSNTPHPSNRESYLNGHLNSSSVSQTLRKTVSILLVPVKVVAVCVTVLVCAALECLSGISVGIILGSGLIMKAYDTHGLIFAMPVSVIVCPMSLVMGAGFALVGLFFGIYDGFYLGWNSDKSLLEDRAKDVKGRLDAFLKKSHKSRFEGVAQDRPTNLIDGDSPPSQSNTDVFGGPVKTKAKAASSYNRGRFSVKSVDASATAASAKTPDISFKPITSSAHPIAASRSDLSTSKEKRPPVGQNPFEE